METRKRSKLWTFFTAINEGKAKCDICQTIYSTKGGSTTNLKKHLAHKHVVSYRCIVSPPSQSSPRPNASQDQGSGTSPSLPLTKSETSPSSTADEVSVPMETTERDKNTKQSLLSSFISSSKKPLNMERTKKINLLILNMIVKDLQPFSMVEDTGFISLMNYIEPTYKIPCRYTLSNTLLDCQYLKIKNQLKEELRGASHISLTTDGWTSRTMTSYQAITAHYFINWQIKSALLGCFECHERHTGEYIKTQIMNLVSDWEIKEKIVACVTDNAANMKAAVRLTGFEHFPCVAHSINLVVRAALREDDININIKKIKAIVEYFHRSPVASKKLSSLQEQLRPRQKPLKLIMDVATRWNSTLDMFERLLVLQEPLVATLGMLHNPVENLSEYEWQVLPQIIQVLKPFKELTEEVSAEKRVTISMVIVAIESIFGILDNLSPSINTDIGKNLLIKIRNEMKLKFKHCDRHELLSKSAMLDVRFGRLAFRDESAYECAKNYLKIEIEKTVSAHRSAQVLPETEAVPVNLNESTLATAVTVNDSSSSLWSKFDAKAKASITSTSKSSVAASIITLRQYIEEKNIPRDECPLKWWKARAILYPELSSLADKYLSIMATSVPSERTFSKSGIILSDKRSSLKPKRMEKILFLNMNQRFF